MNCDCGIRATCLDRCAQPDERGHVEPLVHEGALSELAVVVREGALSELAVVARGGREDRCALLADPYALKRPQKRRADHEVRLSYALEICVRCHGRHFAIELVPRDDADRGEPVSSAQVRHTGRVARSREPESWLVADGGLLAPGSHVSRVGDSGRLDDVRPVLKDPVLALVMCRGRVGQEILAVIERQRGP